MLIHMHENVIGTALPQNFLGPVPGQPLCTFIPVSDLMVPVHEVDAIMKVVQDLLQITEKQLFIHFCLLPPAFNQSEIDYTASAFILI